MLKLANVKKSFAQKEIVKGISFEVKKGEAFGLLGPNGAGKSTTIAMICGLLSYDSGEITIDGQSIHENPNEVKKKIGFVPQDIALYPTMNAMDNLVFWGNMYGLSRKEAKRKAAEIVEVVGLSDRKRDRIETFSGGMKRRINIGVALMHSPELLIMDEPTVGIDPQSRHHILETVQQLHAQGMTIIYTSHYMNEVEFLCKRIAIIDHGELLAIGDKKELQRQVKGETKLQIVVDRVCNKFLQQLQGLTSVQEVTQRTPHELMLVVQEDENLLMTILNCAQNLQIKVQQLAVQEVNLETLFLQLTGRTLRQ